MTQAQWTRIQLLAIGFLALTASAAPGSVIAAPGSAIAVPGSVITAPGSAIAVPGSVIAATAGTRTGFTASLASSGSFYPATDAHIRYGGRADASTPGELRFWGPGAYMQIHFEGSSCLIYLKDQQFGADITGFRLP